MVIESQDPLPQAKSQDPLPQAKSQDPLPAPRPTTNLSHRQVVSFNRMEPKTLGAIQIIIGCLIVPLGASLQSLQEVHITHDVWVFEVVAVQVIISGSVLIHSGRLPSLLWVKITLILHLVSAAFSTAALGLMSKHLPYIQWAYHCEHCRRLENNTVILIDGILSTVVIFLVLELIICITAMLFGLSVLAKSGLQSSGGSQCPVYPQTQPHPPTSPAARAQPHPPASPAIQPAIASGSQQVAVVVTEPEPDHVDTPSLDSRPPTPPSTSPPSEPRVYNINNIN